MMGEREMISAIGRVYGSIGEVEYPTNECSTRNEGYLFSSLFILPFIHNLINVCRRIRMIKAVAN